MAQPIDYTRFLGPREATVKERGAEAGVTQTETSTAASRSATRERETLLPDRTRLLGAQADTAEAKARQAQLALEKAQKFAYENTSPEKTQEAREILMDEVRILREAIDLVEGTFGAAGLGSDIVTFAGSPSAALSAVLQPIVAQEAFGRLQRMRDESPTGGALGNVSNFELDLLKSSSGFTPQGGMPKDVKRGLLRLIENRLRVLNPIGFSADEMAETLGPQLSKELAPKVKSYRFRERDVEALDGYVSAAMEAGNFDPDAFAELMAQSYFNATGFRPDEAYISNAVETGQAMMSEGRKSLGKLDYEKPDEDFRGLFSAQAGLIDPDDPTWGETLGGAAINFVPSAFDLAVDTVRALTVDAPETLEGLGQIIGGATGLSDPAAWEAVKDYYGERYGTMDGFKRALRDDPAAIAADIAGIATGGSLIVAKTAGTAGKVSKIAALSAAARKAEDFGTIAARLDPLNMAAGITTAGAKAGARAAENLGVALPAKLLNVEPTALKQAADAGRRGSETFLENLDGVVPAEDAVTKAQQAVTELYQGRGADYSRRMQRLKRNPETVAFDDVEKAIEGVRTVGRHKGIDISGASGVWNAVDNKVMEFFDKGLNSIEDFDAMKRAIGNIRDTHARGTPEYKVANDVARAINKTITEKAPIYANVMRDYRTASDTLSDIQSSLSLGAKSQDTVLSKLRKTASGKGPRGTTILDLLESTEAGRGLGDMLAGQMLSGTTPTGVGPTIGAMGAVGLGDPTLLAASATSPRGAGRLAYDIGEKVLSPAERATQFLRGTPAAETLSDLYGRYQQPTREGVRTINPVIQSLVDPVDTYSPDAGREDLEALVNQYQLRAPEPMARFGATGVNLSDYVNVTESPEQARAVAAPEETTGDFAPPETGAPPLMIQGRPAVFDPASGRYFFMDTDEPVPGYQRGGAVRGYKNGGLMDLLPDAEDVKGFGRSVAEGAMLGYNDNAEAYLRTLLDKDPKAYKRVLEEIRREQVNYEEDHPGYALTGNLAGALGTAFVPGAQGLSAARVASVGPKARAAYEMALSTGQGLAYGSGKMYDDPDSDRDPLAVLVSETAGGAMGYPATRAAGAVGRSVGRRVPQGAKDFVARKGRDVADRLRVRPRAGR